MDTFPTEIKYKGDDTNPLPVGNANLSLGTQTVIACYPPSGRGKPCMPSLVVIQLMPRQNVRRKMPRPA